MPLAYRERGLRAEKVLQNPDASDRPPKPRFANISHGDIFRDVLGALLFLGFGWLLVEAGKSWEWDLSGSVYIAFAAASPLLTAFWSRYPELSSVRHVIARTPGSAVSVVKWIIFGWILLSFLSSW